MAIDKKYGYIKLPNDLLHVGVAEPIFIIRGKDKCATAAIAAYAIIAESEGASKELVEDCFRRSEEIRDWQSSHTDELKIPD